MTEDQIKYRVNRFLSWRLPPKQLSKAEGEKLARAVRAYADSDE